jgi:hypothetical protein
MSEEYVSKAALDQRRYRLEQKAKDSKSRGIGPLGEENYFYSLCNKKQKKKLKPCLRCRVVFLSNSTGHRICATCTEHNGKQPVRAEFVAESG